MKNDLISFDQVTRKQKVNFLNFVSKDFLWQLIHDKAYRHFLKSRSVIKQELGCCGTDNSNLTKIIQDVYAWTEWH